MVLWPSYIRKGNPICGKTVLALICCPVLEWIVKWTQGNFCYPLYHRIIDCLLTTFTEVFRRTRSCSLKFAHGFVAFSFVVGMGNYYTWVLWLWLEMWKIHLMRTDHHVINCLRTIVTVTMFLYVWAYSMSYQIYSEFGRVLLCWFWLIVPYVMWLWFQMCKFHIQLYVKYSSKHIPRMSARDLLDVKSTLVPVVAWRRQATGHYLNHCWPRSPTPDGCTGKHCFDIIMITIVV